MHVILIDKIWGLACYTSDSFPNYLQFQKIKDAIEMHNTEHCSRSPPKGVGDLSLESVSAPVDKLSGSTET